MRLAIGCIALLACGHPSATESDGGPDAPPEPHPGPPALVATTPGDPAWLHEPVRLVFDEPIASVDLTVTATLAGTDITTSVAVDGDAAAITLDPEARGLGALEVHAEGTVTDPSGDTGPVSADVHLTLAPWSDGDLGDAASPPVVAVDGRGAVFAAWIAGDQVIAGVVYGGTFTPLGAPLGTAASSPAIAIDPQEQPLVGWIDQGTAHVARLTGGAWQELASPGSGDAIALASPGIAAVFGTTATVVELAGDSWQPIGAPVPVASRTGEPALAVGATVAIGWIDGNRIRVYRHDSDWTAIAPIALPAPPSGSDHMSLAMHDDLLVVAYDAWAGSFGVLAAKTTGTRWSRLDHLLDLDAQSDAVNPAVAIDATGAPVVAWTEFVDGMRERGLISRWSGSKWQIVGGTPWLTDPDARPSRPALALHAGGAPVVAWTNNGRTSVARFNGPATLPIGMARASIAGCSFDPNNPPQQLSATGCFTMTTPGQPTAHPGLVPYDVGVELWTDGAKKRRWIGLPDGRTMTNSSTGAWSAPNGTFIVKEFAYERTPGTPATRRAMETRFLAKDASGWRGFSYQWNTAGTNATLLADDEVTKAWPLDDGSSHTHLYPSRSECVTCHQSSYGPLLGIRAPQLARYVDYDGQIGDQLATLAAIGVGPASSATPFVSPHDPSETLEHRMRGYMAANCAHCHNPNDVAVHDLRYTTPLAQTNLCPDIVPGNPGASRTYQLVSSRPGMPALGTLETDPIAMSTLSGWIAGMTSCP
jgi:hypothetical protein